MQNGLVREKRKRAFLQRQAAVLLKVQYSYYWPPNRLSRIVLTSATSSFDSGSDSSRSPDDLSAKCVPMNTAIRPAKTPSSAKEPLAIPSNENVSMSDKISAHETIIRIHPVTSPGIFRSSYVGELRRITIAPIANGKTMETQCRIESCSAFPSAVNSSGSNNRQVKPKSIKGKPNLFLSNEGPIRWKLFPIDMIIKEIQIKPSPPTMYCGQ